MTVTVDREEIIVVGTLADEATDAAAASGRISRFRAETRGDRIGIAEEAQARYGRKVSWGAQLGEVHELFTHISVPVMTRLRQPERRVLDTLVDAGVARSRSEALSWAVTLVGEHAESWLSDLRRRCQRSTSCAPRVPTSEPGLTRTTEDRLRSFSLWPVLGRIGDFVRRRCRLYPSVTTTVTALSAANATAPFEAGTLERRSLRPDDVRIDIAFAGICHSDIHTVARRVGHRDLPAGPRPRDRRHGRRGRLRGHHATRSATASASAASSTPAASAPLHGRRGAVLRRGAAGTYNGPTPTAPPPRAATPRHIVVRERLRRSASPTASTSPRRPRCSAPASPPTPRCAHNAGPGQKVARRRHGWPRPRGRQDRRGDGRRGQRAQHAPARRPTAAPRRQQLLRHRATRVGLPTWPGPFDLIINTVSAAGRLNAYLGLLGRAAPWSSSGPRADRSRSACSRC